MNYIFFAETGADQRIIDEQMKTLLDSFGGADSSKLLLDELATIAEAAPVLTITFIEHLIDTQLCEIIKSQYLGKSPILLSALQGKLDQEGVLYQKPYIESSPAYKSKENGIQ